MCLQWVVVWGLGILLCVGVGCVCGCWVLVLVVGAGWMGALSVIAVLCIVIACLFWVKVD